MANDWIVTLKFKNMVIPAQHISWPEPVDMPEKPVTSEGMQELVQAFVGNVDPSLEIEIVKIERVSK